MLPANYQFNPGYVTNGTLTGPQTPQDMTQRFIDVELDVPLNLAGGQVELNGLSTLAKSVQISGGQLLLADDWTNGAGIEALPQI